MFSLQEKRSIFPRFYFVGDDDLLEILGQATNPTVIQTHLKKLFAGIHSVQFDQDCSHIMTMKSLEGEVVPLKESIAISTDVEVSLCWHFLAIHTCMHMYIHCTYMTVCVHTCVCVYVYACMYCTYICT